MNQNNQKETVINNNYQKEDKSMPASLSANKKMNKPEMIVDQNKNYQVTLHTSEGDITIALNSAETPVTANNFVYLAKNNFYNDTIFHRVIEGFMIQGGDPRGDGTGNPGYRFNDEPISREYLRGTVAMANSGPNSNGSQFFIMHQDYPLPPNYVIFGQVVEGLETVDAIASKPVKSSFGGEMSSPVEPIVLKSVTVTEE